MCHRLTRHITIFQDVATAVSDVAIKTLGIPQAAGHPESHLVAADHFPYI